MPTAKKPPAKAEAGKTPDAQGGAKKNVLAADAAGKKTSSKAPEAKAERGDRPVAAKVDPAAKGQAKSAAPKRAPASAKKAPPADSHASSRAEPGAEETDPKQQKAHGDPDKAINREEWRNSRGGFNRSFNMRQKGFGGGNLRRHQGR